MCVLVAKHPTKRIARAEAEADAGAARGQRAAAEREAREARLQKWRAHFLENDERRLRACFAALARAAEEVPENGLTLSAVAS